MLGTCAGRDIGMKRPGIVVQAFGAPHSILSNRRLAEIASEKARELKAPVYTQLDIVVEPDIEVEHTKEKYGSPPPTLRIARGAVRWAKQRGITELWIIAAKPHSWRVLRDIRRGISEARENIEVHICEEVGQYPEDSWFCPDSTQDRTKSREAWAKREKILTLMPFFIYKLIAS